MLFGIGFIVLGTFMLLLELQAPGTFLIVPATVLIVLGVIGIVVPDALFSWWAPIAAVVVLVPTTLFTIKMYQRLSPPGPPVTTVATSLVGMKGIVTVDVHPHTLRGKVEIEHDTWSATSESMIPIGRRVLVVKSEGVHVVVKEISDDPIGAGTERPIEKDNQ